MRITLENKIFLKSVGQEIYNYSQNTELPKNYKFLSKFTPEQIGLFIAEMFIDYNLDFKKEKHARRKRTATVFEAIGNSTWGENYENAGVLNKSYLQNCAKGFLRALKTDDKVLEWKGERAIEGLVDIWSYGAEVAFENDGLFSVQSYGCLIERKKLALIVKKPENLDELALLKLKEAEQRYFKRRLIEDKSIILPLIYDNFYLNEESKLKNYIDIEASVFYPSEESKEGTLLKVVKNYQDQIKNAQSKEDKIHACFNLASWVQNYHIFPDANGRLGINILNKALQDNGLKPCLLKNQDRFFFEYPILNELDPRKALEMYYEGVKRFEEFIRQQSMAQESDSGLSDIETINLSNPIQKREAIKTYNTFGRIELKQMEDESHLEDIETIQLPPERVSGKSKTSGKTKVAWEALGK